MAIVSVVLAFLLRLLVDPWLGDQGPYLLFVVAVAVTGLYAGVRPALVAAGLGTVVAYFCFVPPRYEWGFAGISDAVGFGVYLLAAIGVILLTHARILAATKAEQSLKSQVAAERQLLDAESLFRHFMNHSSGCAYMRDELGHCVYANEVAMREFGIRPGRSHAPQAEPSRWLKQDRQVLSANEPMEFVDRGAGDERYWLTSKFPFADQSNRKFVGAISFEITDRLRAEEVLRKAERLSAAGQMASLLAHEINNPLAALTNVVYLLNQQPLKAPTQDLLSAGSEALNRINRIAAMTMGFFLDKDTPGPVYVCEIIEEVAETIGSADRFKNIQLIRDFRVDPVIVASRPRIRQVIASLLTNAMESEATQVRVRVRRASDSGRRGRGGIRITIADNGHGILPELREKIFEPFFSSKQEKGTGLGLWASRTVVIRNEGTIKLRSAINGPRRGTCLSVFLPTSADARVLNVHSNWTAGARA